MKPRLIGAVIPALAALAVAAPAGAATSGSSSEAVSENWAGYEATTSNSSGFSAASGSWVVPTVDATKTGTYSAYWVGLGGGGENSSALEQEGTQADVSSSGKVSYYAWYELVPSAPVKVSMKVSPGDKIWARTAVSGDKVTVEIDNKTTGQTFEKTLTMTDATPDTSTAEWVAEAPSECEGGASGDCTPLPLADFGTVKFTNAYATSDGSTKSISGWSDTAIALSAASGSDFGYGGGYGGGFGANLSQASTSDSEGAAPGSLSSDGSAFTVTYGAESSAESTGSAEGSTGLSGSTSGEGSSTGDGYGYGYGASGYGDSGYGYGYGDSGYGDSGYGAGDGYGYGYPGIGSDYGYSTSGEGYSPAGYSDGYTYGYTSYGSPYVLTTSSTSEAYYRAAVYGA